MVRYRHYCLCYLLILQVVSRNPNHRGELWGWTNKVRERKNHKVSLTRCPCLPVWTDSYLVILEMFSQSFFSSSLFLVRGGEIGIYTNDSESLPSLVTQHLFNWWRDSVQFSKVLAFCSPSLVSDSLQVENPDLGWGSHSINQYNSFFMYSR